MKALVVAKSVEAAQELAAGARSMADEVVLVSFASQAPLQVADKVISIKVPEGNIIEDAYVVLNNCVDSEAPQLVLLENERQIKTLGGRLAAHLDTSMIAGVVGFEDGTALCRYFGGVAERGYRTQGAPSIYAVASGVFADLDATGTDLVEELDFSAPAQAIERVASQAFVSSGANLQNAEVILCAGRGFASKDELDMINDLAEKIGAEVACTRPLTEGVDWFSKGSYIGVSGLELTPKVYIGVGVSGQMQHLVGCSKAGKIIAINKDENAPIFKRADLGIVGDLKTVLPALAAAF